MAGAAPDPRRAAVRNRISSVLRPFGDLWNLSWGFNVLIALFSGFFVVLIVTSVEPGPAGLTGVVLCPSDKPDPVVVRRSKGTTDGERVSLFTLYCVGPDGQNENVGAAKPYAILTVWLAAAILVVVPLTRRLRANWTKKDEVGTTQEQDPDQGPIS